MDSSVLLRTLRRVRHVERVIVRNLKVPHVTEAIDMYYTLTLPVDGREGVGDSPFYTSAVARRTLNPSWDYIQGQLGHTTEQQLAIAQECELTLRVWWAKTLENHAHGATAEEEDEELETALQVEAEATQQLQTSPSQESTGSSANNASETAEQNGLKEKERQGSEKRDDDSEKDVMLLECKVNLQLLERVNEKNAATLTALPPNAVLFFLSDGVYSFGGVHEYVKKQLNAAGLSLSDTVPAERSLGKKKIDINQVLKGTTQICEYQQRLASAVKEAQRQQGLIAGQLAGRADQAARARTASLHANRLRHLQNLVEQESAAALEKRKRVQAMRRRLIPRAELIAQQTAQLVGTRADTTEQRNRLNQAKLVTLRSIGKKVNARRQRLIHKLTKVYPITTATKQGQPVLCIRGLPLPSAAAIALVKAPDESIATALGYVCHYVSLLAGYLDVPLRYRIVLCGSRSSLVDDVALPPLQFPLYYRNNEEKRLEYGVKCLQSNIEHVLTATKPDWQNRIKTRPSTVLEVLEILLKHELPILEQEQEHKQHSSVQR